MAFLFVRNKITSLILSIIILTTTLFFIYQVTFGTWNQTPNYALLATYSKFDLVTGVFGSNDKNQVYRSYFGRKLEPPGVILRVRGGIGNQLYQFACHYALAKDRKWPLYVYYDNSRLREYAPDKRDFVLDKFQVPIENIIDSTTHVKDVISLNDEELLMRTFIDWENLQGQFLTLDSSSYCQSIEYWSHYQDDIKRFFNPRPESLNLPRLQPFIDKLENTESVVVHVRRGDVTQRPESYVPISFQRQAILKMIRILETRGKTPTFFLFSDDIQHAKGYFQDIVRTRRFELIFVSEKLKNGTSFQEFYLMTRGKHIIVPCSTFSWWAAFLMKNDNKVVIASTFNPLFFEEDQGRKKLYVREIYGKLFYPKEWIVINPFTGAL